MAQTLTPRFNLEGFQRLSFSYDLEDDIAYVHIDGPVPAVTVEVDDGWYLRLRDDEVVGLELHGLQRIFLATPFYARVFSPAIGELESFSGRALSEGFQVEGSINELPKTTHLLILMIGQAVVKYEAIQRAEATDAGRVLLGSA